MIMKRTISLILFLLCLPMVVKAASLTEVLSDPGTFDQKTVVVAGEAIGELLAADGGYWVNISFEGHNLGVFSQIKQPFKVINYWGSYAETGDYLKLTGKFYKGCILHQIDDIHLESLEVLRTGGINEPEVSAEKIRFANFGLIVCLIVSLVYFLKEKYGTKT